MSWKCLSKNTKGIHSKEPPYAERHVRWCERSENESRKKTTSFSSYSILYVGGLIGKVNANKDGLMPKIGFIDRNVLSGDIDFNTITSTGYYIVKSLGNTTNSPGISWGILIVLAPNEGNDYVYQEAVGRSIKKVRVRDGLSVGGQWSSWI